LKRDSHPKIRREELGQSTMALSKIYMILGGTYTRGYSNIGKIKYGKQVLITAHLHFGK
jgi:hypothetical protein